MFKTLINSYNIIIKIWFYNIKNSYNIICTQFLGKWVQAKSRSVIPALASVHGANQQNPNSCLRDFNSECRGRKEAAHLQLSWGVVRTCSILPSQRGIHPCLIARSATQNQESGWWKQPACAHCLIVYGGMVFHECASTSRLSESEFENTVPHPSGLIRHGSANSPQMCPLRSNDFRSARSTAAGQVECALHGYWPLDIPLRLCRAFVRRGHFPLTLRAQGSWSLADFLVRT